MSKVSSANYPNFTGSAISVGGSTAKTSVSDGTLKSEYDMSDSESDIYNYALNTLANILPFVNTFDTNTLASLQSEVDSYKDSGIQEINDLYNSSLTNLENDVISRFGNLDNSIFSDNLDTIESERADAVSSFAQDVLAKQSDLKSDELTQRYALIKLLTGLSNDIYSNALNAISTSLSGSSNATNYNTEVYNALSNISNNNSRSTNNLLSGLLGLSNSANLSSLLR